ncbi:hypothetical protein EHQ96_15010 [Leptospira levettii]|uniref:Uncharacterized protein n=1 Tax=Leptospira levettii TaxID=2023178 RepID=A0ABY2MHX5_9LEPT|nr:hypothetical protein EHQ34_05865 [Leptospira levettii]TGL14678.1 hypothetical protein EHQ42_12710 [Leptospira levettii]TGL67096.1 hypothetical protein EHQ60_16910 [Leptospira levettii]TGM43366.1 hypothetical protein EHQ75_04075 [Leptospira levettii]TGM65160.1 hypothetical protein EHQ96_15010 [Leptospira levettii]
MICRCVTFPCAERSFSRASSVSDWGRFPIDNFMSFIFPKKSPKLQLFFDYVAFSLGEIGDLVDWKHR